MEIWQTTNQQPWVEAVLSGRTAVKTRTTSIHAPLGAVVLLHASKHRLWPDWHYLSWADDIDLDALKATMGCVCGIATIVDIGESEQMLTAREWKAFTFRNGGGCPAQYGVRFDDIRRLAVPVPIRGFQLPYARAKAETIDAVAAANKDVRKLLGR
jgi:hypothetical protein